jgi:hypothetical protein
MPRACHFSAIGATRQRYGRQRAAARRAVAKKPGLTHRREARPGPAGSYGVRGSDGYGPRQVMENWPLGVVTPLNSTPKHVKPVLSVVKCIARSGSAAPAGRVP